MKREKNTYTFYQGKPDTFEVKAYSEKEAREILEECDDISPFIVLPDIFEMQEDFRLIS